MRADLASAGPPLLLGLLGLLLGLLLWPVLRLLAGGVGDGGVHLHAALTSPDFGQALLASLSFAAGATAVATATGTATALLFARLNFPLRALLMPLLLVPLFVPGALYTLAWVLLASPAIGLLNQLSSRPLVDVYGWAGMVWTEGIQAAPMVFLLVAAMLRSIDTEQEQAAQMAGAGALRTLRSITLPLVAPAVATSSILVFMRAMGTFEVPAMLGVPAGIELLAPRIYHALMLHPGDSGPAAAYASLLLLITLGGVVLLESRWRNRHDLAAHQFSPRARPALRLRRGAGWAACAAALLWLLVTALLPLAALLWAALQPYYTAPGQLSHTTLAAHLSLDGFRRVAAAPEVHAAALNTLRLAAGAAAAVMIFGVAAAWVAEHGPRRVRGLIEALLHSVLALPGMVLGMALLVQHVASPLGLYGTPWLIALAYLTRFLPHGLRYGRSARRQVPAELTAAARVCGAGALACGWWIQRPLMWPVLLAGWLFTLTLCARELSSALLLYAPGGEVIPVIFWQYWESGRLQDLAALSVLFVATLLGIAAPARALLGRSA